jgi:hypothetical protein
MISCIKIFLEVAVLTSDRFLASKRLVSQASNIEMAFRKTVFKIKVYLFRPSNISVSEAIYRLVDKVFIFNGIAKDLGSFCNRFKNYRSGTCYCSYP